MSRDKVECTLTLPVLRFQWYTWPRRRDEAAARYLTASSAFQPTTAPTRNGGFSDRRCAEPYCRTCRRSCRSLDCWMWCPVRGVVAARGPPTLLIARTSARCAPRSAPEQAELGRHETPADLVLRGDLPWRHHVVTTALVLRGDPLEQSPERQDRVEFTVDRRQYCKRSTTRPNKASRCRLPVRFFSCFVTFRPHTNPPTKFSSSYENSRRRGAICGRIKGALLLLARPWYDRS